MKKPVFLFILIAAIFFFDSCKKSEVVTIPLLSTTPISNITYTTSTSGGDITSDGNTLITERGVCWSTSSNSTVSGLKTSDGIGIGQFVSNITGLEAGLTYYVRAYAVNSVGIAYGDEVSFTTNNAQRASLSTTSLTSITATKALSGGNISTDNGATITARGVCWGTGVNPTISGSHTTDGTGKGSFISSLTGLSPVTSYYVRAYATNSEGTSYGNEILFSTIISNEVIIQGDAFSPVILTVPINTTVKWTNNDAVNHTISSETGLFESGVITHGGTYSFQFTSAGTYSYHCTIHPFMTGKIVVQ